MLMTRLQSAWRCALAAAATAATLATPAHADSVTGFVQADWDPPYGAPFSNLGWRGSALIEVGDGCTSAGNGSVVVGTSTCSVTVQNAIVELYDLSDVGTTLETLDFTALVGVSSLFVRNAQVAAFSLTSNDDVFIRSTISQAVPDGGFEQAFFGLVIEFDNSGGSEPMLTRNEAILNWYRFSETPSGVGITWAGRNDPNQPAVVQISQIGPSTGVPVPVPATLSLALAGLALLAAARRR